MKKKSSFFLAMVFLGTMGVAGLAWAQIQPTQPKLYESVPQALIPIVSPCSSVTLYSASVIRNNKPDQIYYGAPTYSGSISYSGTTWTVRVPAEAYDLTTPYLVRFGFHKGQVLYLDEYHPALTVLTKQQAETLGYISRTDGHALACVIKVTTPRGLQVGSMVDSSYAGRMVTDDWPADVGYGGQYGLEIWYFSTQGVFTKQGNYSIRLDSCTASPSNRFYCQ